MRRCTEFALRHRRVVLVAWILALVLGGAGAANVGSLLSNTFNLPGSAAQRGLVLLHQRFHERSDGAFTLVAQALPGHRLDASAVEAAARRGAGALAHGHAGPVLPAAPGVSYVQIDTSLQNAPASDRTPAVRRAIATVPGAHTYLTGFPAINHDTAPLYSQDLARGEEIAIPIAVLVMAFMFATVGGIVVPLAFAAFTITTSLGLVWVLAHFMTMATYVTNVVSLIGIGIAIDYSMLVVFRFREELAAGAEPQPALMRAMATAGRATVFSGLTVAVGLALLAFVPVPLIRSMGIGGLLIPLVSVIASLTLLPVLLSLLGTRINSLPLLPRRAIARRAVAGRGFWMTLSRVIMRRPLPILVASAALMLAIATPARQLAVTAGDNRGYPSGTPATNGLFVLERTLGPGSLAPDQVLIDTGRPRGALAPGIVAAERRLVVSLRADRSVNAKTIVAPFLVTAAQARAARLLDPSEQIAQVRAASYQDSGSHQAMALVRRIRGRYVPEARFPGATVVVTGAPAFGVDFINQAYGAFPWLVAAVLVISYFLLLRAFRSVLLPIKAVFMNLLSVAATYGVLVLCFQHGAGRDLFGLHASPQIDGWIPIFLFAMLFGLSMDYEVFLLTRMREEWDHTGNNEHAVASGLERTGRIITAAAVIMIAAFSGFATGRFVGLQEFGIGLAAAILLDATVVRALLVPATMKLLGRWNWYLPNGVRRALRLAPEPARQRQVA
jgi:RND superfamily putative drug exporter